MKKFALVFFSVFLLISAPFAAYANIVTTTGKYLINAVKSIPSGARVEATNTATGAKHAINHGVSASALGLGIGAGLVSFGVGSGAGLAFQAITGLALDAVDWLMDPANNRVKYKPKSSEGRYLWKAGGGLQSDYIYPTAQAAGVAVCNHHRQTYKELYSGSPNAWYYVWCVTADGSRDNWDVRARADSGYDADGYKSISLDTLAAKTIELANGGNAAAQQDIVDYVTNLAKNGELDTELDNSIDITKPDDPTTCSAGTVKIGDTCIKLPDPDSPDTAGCGSCCSELLAILIATAKLNADFYAKSLDNDAKALAALNQINAQITKLNADFNLLLNEAKLTNKTLTEINEGQDLHFTELKQKVDDLKLSVETGNANILTKLSEVDASIKQSNEKLDKLNENLEKMQKCEGTEFNKKLCDFVNWMQSDPAESTPTPVDVKDVDAENSNKIDMAGECPSPYELNFAVLGYEQNHSISYEPLCGALVLLKPIFVGSGALSGMFILMGYSRASNTGVN